MNEILELQTNTLSSDDFAGQIQASWNKAVESVIQTAQTLKQAEIELERKEFKKLKDHLQQSRIMSGPTITKLLKIASNEVLTAVENLPLLPPSYATLYELSQHEPSIIQNAMKDGTVHSAIQHKELASLLPPRKKKQMSSKTKSERISVSVKFSAKVVDVPEELLQKLRSVIAEIKQKVDVKTTGLES